MPDFTVGGRRGNKVDDPPFDFSKIAMLGNAGKKLNDLVYGELLDPHVKSKTEGDAAPGAGVKPGILLSARSPRKLLQKLFLNFGELNPAGAELLPGQLPNGRILTQEEQRLRAAGLLDPQILAMWDADP